ncbi:uncharacterized protein [Miscanthus floridulus]|uniref:uncharacterized protein n=1 Tax=Miscanthus floridulus TaxID=154761 RepID=UPI003459CBBC
MSMGQFVYCGRRTTLSIGDILPLHGILEGAVICNVEHHASDCGAPPLGRLGTMPSSSAATPITASGRGSPPTEGRPQHMTVKPTVFGTLQRSSFGSSDPSSAQEPMHSVGRKEKRWWLKGW